MRVVDTHIVMIIEKGMGSSTYKRLAKVYVGNAKGELKYCLEIAQGEKSPKMKMISKEEFEKLRENPLEE